MHNLPTASSESEHHDNSSTAQDHQYTGNRAEKTFSRQCGMQAPIQELASISNRGTNHQHVTRKFHSSKETL
ncbi:hypothetical protein Nepgr_013433 [Nepenthes gracilis]|uniref:Uncharacterized protein n=1 Tax=Nepenthes gracilis TaxID=150966 RepID=A0AAD3XNN3_NEPGR|nr:hypothetical protein Nepgr_013433 [Nepenthes gracilis]